MTRTGRRTIEAPVRSAPIGKELEGPWSATLEGTYPNGIPRRIILTLSNQADGTSTGAVFNPADGLEIPVTSITQKASSVTLDLRAVNGSYSGTVNADGSELKGTFIQGTTVLPITFRRAPDRRAPDDSTVFCLAALIGVTLVETSGTAARSHRRRNPAAGRVSANASGARDWLQWGGPTRNFMSDSTGLASSWPAAGPRKLWSRTLGEGHSSIVVENGRLYTMYRQITRACRRHDPRGSRRCLDAATGKTLWEFEYPAPTAGIDFSQGSDPHSTPLIVGNRVFATSSRSELFALDKATGKPIWSHDMVKEFRRSPAGRGYTCSPIFHNGLVIVTMGGPDQAVAAFDAQTGKLAWKSGYFVLGAGLPHPDRRRRAATARRLRRRLDRRHRSRQRPRAVEPSAQDRLGPEHQHAGLVGRRSSALCVLGLWDRQPGARTASGRGQDDGHREVGQQSHARAHRHGDPARRLRVRIERRFRTGVHLRHRHEDRRDRLAGSELRARAAALRRRQARSSSTRTGTLGLATVSPQASRCWRAPTC